LRSFTQEFEEFSKSWDFIHVKCSPYKNQTNALAEAMVKVAKVYLKRKIMINLIQEEDFRNIVPLL
jgi:transposase